jgi:phage protein D
VEGRGNDLAFEYSDNDLLSIGKSVTVKAGSHENPEEIFRGTITALEMQMGRGTEPRLTVLAEDALQKARLNRRTRRHDANTISSIVQSVASDLGLQTDITGMDMNVDDQLQFNESDLAFLRRILDRVDGDLQIAGDVLTVAPRSGIRRSRVTLDLGSQLISVRVLADIAHQVNTVTFSGWDVSSGQEITVDSDGSADMGPGQGRAGSEFVRQAYGDRSEHLSHAGAQNESEAQALVNAAFSERVRKFVCAEGVAEGNPGIRVGTHLTLQGLGPRFQNTYFVTKVRHHYDLTKGYRTIFSAECAYLGA